MNPRRMKTLVLIAYKTPNWLDNMNSLDILKSEDIVRGSIVLKFVKKGELAT